ncbi:MAG TPA: 16S rRNA (cytosine(967)-C(5))-methyltransferase, partial [Coxiellaceae bacterium]|nr:16S rRNA (cytosine(967)-C(5))-methyltransferase [Coxiellaceae bacterium]
MNIRADAAAIVTQVVVQKKSLDDALPDYLKKYDEARDKALLQELSYGTLRWHHKLDAITKSLLTKTSKKTDVLVHSLILVGLYQLLYLRIPHHATLFETVAATHTIKKLWAKGLVNAVLRNFIRGQEKILAQIENTPNTNEFAGYFN